MTKIVGILNVTPDSFSDGGAWNSVDAAVTRTEQLFREGADIIDIGAESTRPGAESISSEEEWRRLQPIVEQLKVAYEPSKFSIDTRHSEVIKRVIDTWSPEIILNDVTGLRDIAMRNVALEYDVTAIVSHLPTSAQGDIEQAHQHKVSDVSIVKRELDDHINQLTAAGIDMQKLIVDPGIGFGKTATLNRELVSFAEVMPDFPIMIGYSRKRFIGEQRFMPGANVALGRLAVLSGAAYLRVHDVAAHYALVQYLQQGQHAHG